MWETVRKFVALLSSNKCEIDMGFCATGVFEPLPLLILYAKYLRSGLS